VICNIDLNDIIAYHQRTDADMTIAVKTVELTAEQAKTSVLLTSDDDGRITDCIAYPMDFEGKADMNLNIIVMKTKYLQQIVLDAITHNHTSLTRDVIARNMGHHNYRVYKYDGYFACITSFTEYYKHSLELISNPEAREALFNVKDRPVYTKVRNSTPAYYSSTSNVKDSFIADGCVIEGTVENSILFRGVKVDRKATVKNSIIMQGCTVKAGACIENAIIDRGHVIAANTVLRGCEDKIFVLPKAK